MDGKRVFDILVSSGVLVLTLPFMLVAVAGIKLTSRGPVLFKAVRVGKGGVDFQMHKLRTMHVHDANKSQVITGPNDPRIFGFGKALRQTKLDEIPQFIDVLRGKMSVVGPRPEDPEIVRKYYSEEQKETLLVKPGVTSPAALYFSMNSDQQLTEGDTVESYVNNLLDKKLKYERDYILKSGMWQDVRVVWDTFLFVVRAFFRYLFGLGKPGRG